MPMNQERFRRLALELPDAVEGSHHDHADFRVRGRVFASLHPDGVRAMVKVGPAVQQRLCALPGGTFAPANGAWGRAGCTLFVLASTSLDVVRDSLREAWEFAGASAPTRTTKRTTRAAKPARRTPRRS
ncbi:MAG: MmcQ/YjbR family DNA-binding protein [Planctomycetes bacterium]|nr:MmcQ/YjbR family DNA-binding protein [Planctomycetota bacterium]